MKAQVPTSDLTLVRHLNGVLCDCCVEEGRHCLLHRVACDMLQFPQTSTMVQCLPPKSSVRACGFPGQVPASQLCVLALVLGSPTHCVNRR